MDVLSVAASPVAISNPQNSGGVSRVVQTAPVVSNSATSIADAPVAVAPQEVPSSSRVAQAVKQVNDAFIQKGLNLYASFEKDKISGVDIVKIMEKKSNEVIRQLPPEEVVIFAQSLELPAGWRGQWIRNMT